MSSVSIHLTRLSLSLSQPSAFTPKLREHFGSDWCSLPNSESEGSTCCLQSYLVKTPCCFKDLPITSCLLRCSSVGSRNTLTCNGCLLDLFRFGRDFGKQWCQSTVDPPVVHLTMETTRAVEGVSTFIYSTNQQLESLFKKPSARWRALPFVLC